jgi:hypothetical protein
MLFAVAAVLAVIVPHVAIGALILRLHNQDTAP